MYLECIGGFALLKYGHHDGVRLHVAGLTGVVTRLVHRHRADSQGRSVDILKYDYMVNVILYDYMKYG